MVGKVGTALAGAALVMLAACDRSKPDAPVVGGDPSTIAPSDRTAPGPAAEPAGPPPPSSGPDATVNLGAVGEITAANDIASCNEVWQDLTGHWVSMTARPKAEIDDYMRRGLNACEATQRRVAANQVEGSTPECARWVDESVAALRRFTTDVDLTDGAQADASMSLVSGVRAARSACADSVG